MCVIEVIVQFFVASPCFVGLNFNSYLNVQPYLTTQFIDKQNSINNYHYLKNTSLNSRNSNRRTMIIKYVCNKHMKFKFIEVQ